MKLRIFLLSAMLILAGNALGQNTKPVATAPHAQAPPAAPTLASAIDGEISAVEKQLLDAAEAMPEDKFNFSPENLNLPGSDYKGVRTFAVQVKHIAASNYFIWSGLTGEKLPANLGGGRCKANRRENLRYTPHSFLLSENPQRVGQPHLEPGGNSRV